VGGLGTVVAGVVWAGSSGDVVAATVDRWDPVESSHRCAVAGYAGPVRAVADRSWVVPPPAKSRSVGAADHPLADDGGCGGINRLAGQCRFHDLPGARSIWRVSRVKTQTGAGGGHELQLPSDPRRDGAGHTPVGRTGTGGLRRRATPPLQCANSRSRRRSVHRRPVTARAAAGARP
jgi:hypothetical protein